MIKLEKRKVREIENAIREILDDYAKNERKYTTEGDIVSHLFAKLSNIYFGENIFLHSQVRPFKVKGEIKNAKVITKDKSKKGRYEWKQQEKANEGNVVDLAILDMNEKHWGKTIKKANRDQIRYERKDTNSLRYWRILSYPVEAFLVAIEIKARVGGNKNRIEEDISKLTKIREVKAPKDMLQKIEREARRRDIDFYARSATYSSF